MKYNVKISIYKLYVYVSVFWMSKFNNTCVLLIENIWTSYYFGSTEKDGKSEKDRRIAEEP